MPSGCFLRPTVYRRRTFEQHLNNQSLIILFMSYVNYLKSGFNIALLKTKDIRKISKDKKATFPAIFILVIDIIITIIQFNFNNEIPYFNLYNSIFYIIILNVYFLIAYYLISRFLGSRENILSFIRPFSLGVIYLTLFSFLSFVPIVGIFFQILVYIWTMVLTYFVIRESFKLSSKKSIAVIIISYFILFIVIIVIGIFIGYKSIFYHETFTAKINDQIVFTHNDVTYVYEFEGGAYSDPKTTICTPTKNNTQKCPFSFEINVSDEALERFRNIVKDLPYEEKYGFKYYNDDIDYYVNEEKIGDTDLKELIAKPQDNTFIINSYSEGKDITDAKDQTIFDMYRLQEFLKKSSKVRSE